MERDLRAGGSGDLRLLYQPIVELASGRVVELEALLRWQSRDRGLPLPSDFLVLAEVAGLIAEIANWVLEEACREMTDGPADRPVCLGVNIAGASCPNPA